MDSEIEQKGFYERNYKKLMIIPIGLFLVSLLFFGFKYAETGSIIAQDISLTGGTSLTVYTSQKIDVGELESVLGTELDDVIVRRLSDLTSRTQIGLVLETTSGPEELKEAFVKATGIELTAENSSVEFTGSTLSKAFFSQLVKALVLAFAFMAVVVFVIFRVFVPAAAVIFAALSDIVITLAIVSMANLRLGTAGIAALLMLIGYSVDTDILLTTRLLKRHDKELVSRMKEALRTGLTMTLTSIVVLFVAYLLVLNPVLKQIFIILTVGLFIDLINTWFFNASILKMYVEKK